MRTSDFEVVGYTGTKEECGRVFYKTPEGAFLAVSYEGKWEVILSWAQYGTYDLLNPTTDVPDDLLNDCNRIIPTIDEHEYREQVQPLAEAIKRGARKGWEEMEKELTDAYEGKPISFY